MCVCVHIHFDFLALSFWQLFVAYSRDVTYDVCYLCMRLCALIHTFNFVYWYYIYNHHQFCSGNTDYDILVPVVVVRFVVFLVHFCGVSNLLVLVSHIL